MNLQIINSTQGQPEFVLLSIKGTSKNYIGLVAPRL